MKKANSLGGTQIRTGGRGFAIHCLTTVAYKDLEMNNLREQVGDLRAQKERMQKKVWDQKRINEELKEKYKEAERQMDDTQWRLGTARETIARSEEAKLRL